MSTIHRTSIQLALVIILIASIPLLSCSKDKKKGLPGAPGSTGTGTTGTGTGTGTITGTGTGGGGGQYVISGTQTQFDFDWTVNGNATQAQLDQIKSGIEDSGGGLYQASEGRMKFGNQNLYNMRNDGNVVIVNDLGGSAGICRMRTYGSELSYFIELVGTNFATDVFLHEHCHGQFWKNGEEYNCSVCVMGTHIIGTTVHAYCYSGNCKALSNPMGDCWGDFITPKYGWSRSGNRPAASSAPPFTVYVN